MTPFGDVYGGGSPTGNAFYENGALGAAWEGTFLAAEAGRNEVFSYQPKPSGANFALDRKIFLTSNKEQKYAGSDFLGGGSSVTSAVATLFRPSDVTVGPDGAIYVTDWIDARVGGHQDLDNETTGAIYRIAPKGFVVAAADVRRQHDRRADHRAALAGDQRPRHRLQRSEGARRGRRSARSPRC